MNKVSLKLLSIIAMLNFSIVELYCMDILDGQYSGEYHKRSTSIGKSGYQRSRSRGRSSAVSVSYPKANHTLPMINTPSRPYLNWLVDGTKKAEGRVNGPACRKMKVGDTILLCDRRRGQYVYGTIAFKNEYSTFEEMLLAEKVSNMLPFLRDDQITEGLKTYSSFPGAARVKELGCVAIGISVANFSISE